MHDFIGLLCNEHGRVWVVFTPSLGLLVYGCFIVYKKNVYRRTLIEDRPRLAVIFLAI
ncbi:hypothetical protein PAJ34TS1_12170 [Paenibacillus azoreducens]|uniref:Uncharacterized protein n=1 Tax=Paenibacillus azoreducens TaxID=116718 RepID=A0A919YKX4_9BACL|nr:hypothetical protein J34TS1_60250 [Paenibacillus azoreducens]